SVLGAGGKMGSGILLLTAMEMFRLSHENPEKKNSYQLNAIDLSDESLRGVSVYLREQLRKAAEKQIVLLRELYSQRKDLIENAEIIDQYILDVMQFVRPGTSIEEAIGSDLVFEAVSENPELKVKLIREIERSGGSDTWYLTNTSSIPIGKLDMDAGLKGRIIGFHFYNPPAVQKLVELICSDTTLPELNDFCLEFAKNLKKKVVPSNDVAGFIGNGHFMRDILYGASEVHRLEKDYTLPQAIWMINRVTQDYLIRPMGIFQLTDYVGLDVCQFIMKVMDPYMEEENLHCELIDRMLEQGVYGGQNPDGSQKNGFLSYDKGGVSGVWDPENKEYIPADQIDAELTPDLGPFPGEHIPWKVLISDPEKTEKLETYFNSLSKTDTMGARLAMAYGRNSKQIGLLLVDKKVAGSIDDVNTVLLTGFFHAYGPIQDYFN
ncbi:3-hydroxyacyl-CoA dehydrogenase family protein, partial [Bacteroidota bacterium]